MNILHISSATSWRGGEQQIAYLIDELDQLGHSNILMHPFNAPISNHQSIQSKYVSIPYKKYFSLNPLVAYKIKQVVKTHEINIIHAHDSHAHSFLYLSYWLLNLTTISVVSRRVDFSISKSSFKKYSEKKIRKIICVSNKIKEIVSDSLGESNRITTIHSGVDLNKFSSDSALNLRKTYNIPTFHRLVGNVSAIADHKDYTTFVNTAALVLKQKPDITFLIIGGDGGEQDKIYNHINKLGLSKSIIMTGYIENAYNLIKQLDVFFFPSKMEGLGTSILDAQCSSVPVVSTYAGGIPELIKHKETGLLSRIGDTRDLAKNINLILEDIILKTKITNKALANVSNFSKKATALNTISVYKSVT